MLLELPQYIERTSFSYVITDDLIMLQDSLYVTDCFLHLFLTGIPRFCTIGRPKGRVATKLTDDHLNRSHDGKLTTVCKTHTPFAHFNVHLPNEPQKKAAYTTVHCRSSLFFFSQNTLSSSHLLS